MVPSEIIYETLKSYWGYDRFRDPQEKIINTILEGYDVLALLPTGAGKSLCYQLPAIISKGCCIVVTPLISLMKNQVESLQKMGLEAIAIHGGLTKREIDIALDNAIYGNTKFLYLSPERLTTDLFKTRLEKLNISFIAVDEAHCIAQWGHDFRPAYLQISALKLHLPELQIVAFTATATAKVKKEIIASLALNNDFKFFRKSFAKPNLSYSLIETSDKLKELIRLSDKFNGSGIIYVRNRQKCRDISFELNKHKISAAPYHAGMEHSERDEVQFAWMSNKIKLVVATNAFGMGIDKPDVQFVIHHTLPESLEEYYQEAGRAGRDQQKAWTVLLYNSADEFDLNKKWENNYPEFKFISEMYTCLCSYFEVAVGSGEGETFPFDIIAFVNHFQLSLLPTIAALKEIERNGWIVLTESVFEPAKCMILLDRSELEYYIHSEGEFSVLLQLLIRNYESLFTQLVPLSLKKLSKLIEKDEEDVHKQLVKMAKLEILEYVPVRDSSGVQFICDRVSRQNFTIDLKAYKLRKSVSSNRIKHMLLYAKSSECREHIILSYFGEFMLQPCGRCDVCLGAGEINYSDRERDSVQRLLKMYTVEDFVPLKEWVELYPVNERERVLNIIDHFIHEGLVEIEANDIRWKK